MKKVQITYFGKKAIVDFDQVNLLKKKEALVSESVNLKVNNSKKIINLNRIIRRNVIFI